MTAFLSYWLQSELAGIWPLVAAYGLGGILAAVLLILAWLSPSLTLKKRCIEAAIIIAVGMAIFSVGVTKGERRVQSQWDAAKAAAAETGKKARSDAERYVDRKPSRWVPNHRDAYDRDGK